MEHRVPLWRRFARRLAVLLCLTLLHAAPPVSVRAASLSELEQEKNAAAAEAQRTQNELNAIRYEQERIETEMQTLDENLTQAWNDLETINRSLDETMTRLAEAEAALEQAQADRDAQYEHLKERLRVMNEYGEAGLLEVLLQATSIRDFLTRLDVVNNIAKNDLELATRMQEAEDRLYTLRENETSTRNTVEVLKTAQQQEITDYEAALAEHTDYLMRLGADEASKAALLEIEREAQRVATEAYSKEAARVAAERAAATARSAVVYDGIMKWPVPVYKRISQYYENRTHPITGGREFHDALDIAANSGNNIIAAEGGRVIMSKRNGSYGNCVIIDHGGGLSTLYGHASRLLVSEGQQVAKGDVIALVGSTGMSTGPHLHFEVRENGKTVNPRGYLGY